MLFSSIDIISPLVLFSSINAKQPAEKREAQ
jgi:hypothetical protein